MTDTRLMAQQQLADWLLRRSPSSGARRVLPFASAIASETGLVRSDNQDRAAIAHGRDIHGMGFVVAAIADGIGGMQDGQRCASIALAALLSSALEQARTGVPSSAWLENAFTDANRAVYAEYSSSGGTTLSALLVLETGGGYWASVGDSRIYALSNDIFVQLSKDDTIAGQLGRQPNVAIEQSKLIQYIGIGNSLEVSVTPVGESEQGLAILTTDGVHFLERSKGVFELVIRHAGDVGSCARRLIELSRWAGGPDNATVIAIPFNIEFGTNMPASSTYLDVWDAFGEIRIVEATQLPTGRKSLQPERDAPVRNHEVNEELPALKDNEFDDSNAPVSSIAKRKRKAKSRSKVGGKVPQVQIQFSDKDD